MAPSSPSESQYLPVEQFAGQGCNQVDERMVTGWLNGSNAVQCLVVLPNTGQSTRVSHEKRKDLVAC